MEIDYIFPRGIFSSKKSVRAKILSEWKNETRKSKTFLNQWESMGFRKLYYARVSQ